MPIGTYVVVPSGLYFQILYLNILSFEIKNKENIFVYSLVVCNGEKKILERIRK